VSQEQFDREQFDIARADRASTILEEPMVAEALSALKTGVRDLFFETPAEAAEQRERLHLLDRARQHFETVFRIHIMGGAVARDSLMSDVAAADALAAIQQRAKER
jgi:hypothetical protein